MVVVLIIAVAIGAKVLRNRASEYRRIALDHRLAAVALNRVQKFEMLQIDGTLRDIEQPPNLVLVDFHNRMSKKYEHAARYPWLPVDPDPPDPE